MRRITFYLICLCVFTIPLEQLLDTEGVISISRIVGAAAIGLGVLTVLTTGRVRRPGYILVLSIPFVFANVVSLLWTISVDASIQRVFTYAQLVAVVWLFGEFATEEWHLERVFAWYCFGSVIAIADDFRNFALGISYRTSAGDVRFAATNFDPNEFGITLALGIPLAWYLVLHGRGAARIVAGASIPLACVAILLTGSRAAFLAVIVGLSIIPLTVSPRSFVSWLKVAAVLVFAGVAVAWVVPSTLWERVLTVGQELEGGTMSGRTTIWDAGFSVFREKPLLGVGAGAFAAAVEPVVGARASHNVFLAVLVEQGIVGFVTFAALLLACAWRIGHAPAQQRRFWTSIAITWLIGALSLSWQSAKITWLLISLLSTGAVRDTRRTRAAQALPQPRRRDFGDVRGLPQPS